MYKIFNAMKLSISLYRLCLVMAISTGPLQASDFLPKDYEDEYVNTLSKFLEFSAYRYTDPELDDFLNEFSPEELQEPCYFETDNDEYNLLHYAARQGEYALLKKLIENKAMNPEEKTLMTGRAVLHLAAWKGRLEVVKYLAGEDDEAPKVNLDATTPTGGFALYLASELGDDNRIGVIDVLLANGANPLQVDQHGFTILHRAVEFNNMALLIHLSKTYPELLEKLKTVKAHYGDYTPLTLAEDLGRSKEAIDLLS